MKNLLVIVIYAILAWSQQVSAAILTDGGRLPEELRFVIQLYSDSSHTTDEERAEWCKRIRETPDITNKLFDILWEYVELRAGEEISEVLEALGVAGDLTPDQMKRITDRMRILVDTEGMVTGSGQMDLDKQGFLTGGMTMLGSYPSPDHEDLVLRILKIADSGVQEAAVITLGKIGTGKSLGPVRRFVEARRRPIDPAMAEEIEVMEQRYGKLKKPATFVALEQLERRVKSSGRRGAEGHKDFRESGHGPSSGADWSKNRLVNSVTVAGFGILILGIIWWWVRARQTRNSTIR